jgi:thousand and one amino acid protein kinase
MTILSEIKWLVFDQSADVSSKRDTLRNQMDTLKQQHLEAEQVLKSHHRTYLDLEIRKLRRCKLLQFHLLEQNLLKEV